MFKSITVKTITVLTLAVLLMANMQSSAVGNELSKQRINLLIGGGSATGFSARLAEGCAEAIRRALPNWSVTATAGAIASNIKFVHEGEMQLTVAYPELVVEANKGTGTYKTVMPDIKMIANLTTWPTQIILLEKISINSLQEWKQNKSPLRINIQKAGSGSGVLNRRVLNAYGITMENIKSWGGTLRYEGGTKSMELIRDGFLDGSIMSGSCPNAGIIQLGGVRKIKMLPLDPEIIKQLADQYGYLKATISAGTYKWLKTDVPTVAAGVGISGTTKLKAGVVREITRAMVEQIDYMRTLHKSLKTLTTENLTEIPGNIIHPEAREYYESIGLKIKN